MQAALRAYAEGITDEAPVVAAFRVLSEEADARRLRAEAVLLAFKRLWLRMVDAHAVPDRGDRDRMYSHLVKLCVATYFQR